MAQVINLARGRPGAVLICLPAKLISKQKTSWHYSYLLALRILHSLCVW